MKYSSIKEWFGNKSKVPNYSFKFYIQLLEKYKHYILCDEFLNYQIDDSDEWNNNSDKLLQIDPKKTFVESVNTLSSLLTGAWIKVAFSLALKGFMEGMGQWKDW